MPQVEITEEANDVLEEAVSKLKVKTSKGEAASKAIIRYFGTESKKKEGYERTDNDFEIDYSDLETNSDDIIDIIFDNPKYYEVFLKILKFEENNKGDPGPLVKKYNERNGTSFDVTWNWRDVGVQPQRLNKLSTNGIVTIIYSSNKHTDYALTNREKVKKAIKEFQEIKRSRTTRGV